LIIEIFGAVRAKVINWGCVYVITGLNYSVSKVVPTMGESTDFYDVYVLKKSL
jgi:hypothetical protein